VSPARASAISANASIAPTANALSGTSFIGYLSLPIAQIQMAAWARIPPVIQMKNAAHRSSTRLEGIVSC
jgi:hypothetical protein